MNALRKLFTKPEPIERRRAARHAAADLIALSLQLDASTGLRVKDISATGMYLLTAQRWTSATPIPFTLRQTGGEPESAPETYALSAAPVRSGEDGVGFCFALPEGVDAARWADLVDELVQEMKPGGDFVTLFRTAQAIAFLREVCPSAEPELRVLAQSQRITRAVNILLHAEQRVRVLPAEERRSVHPNAVWSVIHHGSWAQECWLLDFWAGLLVASFSPRESDDSPLALIDLFNQLSPEHVRILKNACSASGKYLADTGEVQATPLVCTPREMIELVGTRNLLHIGRVLRHLSTLGLLRKQVELPSLLESFEADITPTSYGLRLFAACNGFRSPQAFYPCRPASRRTANPMVS